MLYRRIDLARLLQCVGLLTEGALRTFGIMKRQQELYA